MTMSETIHLTEYLFRRLREAGLQAVHGVPGDYNLLMMDYIVPTGLEWVGNCNELNAGYAADGYARVKGIGALVTTFGVGELSAINAVAGSYAEMAPVVHIVGTPKRAMQMRGAKLHHSVCSGKPSDFTMFAEMYSKITVAQENLWDASTAPGQIDRLIRECVIQSRPVYLQVPADMVTEPIPAAALASPLDLSPPVNDREAEQEVCDIIVERISNAKQPFILIDAGTSRYGLANEADELVKSTGFPTATTPFGKGIADETLPNFHGIYASLGQGTYVPYVESCDLIINIGPVHSNVNTTCFTTIPNPNVSIVFDQTCITIDGRVYNIFPKGVLRRVLDHLQDTMLSFWRYPKLPDQRAALKRIPSVISTDALTQDIFFKRMSHFFQPGDIVLTETGTASNGGRDFVFPQNVSMINSGVWLSIGYMLGAAQGVTLAQRNMGSQGRTILFIGDGSFQVTAQELSTIIRKKLSVIIFLINNDGYTIERLIHGMNEEYNDIAMWRYLDSPSYFGAPSDDSYPVFTARVQTWGELDGVLSRENFQRGPGLRMVELMMGVSDCTESLRLFLQMYASRKE
ncbi:pyruvate decarboxylase [Aspergillus nomiae NRRL 13137]|uniref:Pyruvate decarboxylase n=1 Tax=Aspergillus nomiae NRRL (strain ATCC 15546 / NRRL 13137 / CBS 260.88 / M93) TaxID=1509407 RepID=A0A0L1JFY1_ASPN3|nr:pyruvate decarboxylase [Aspergillus nomiae NRRL 13137]KNG90680.1 pyruvate decarboxylase [Aspergillus nomiae NRRL 13137]